jgi:hypothetical protein
VSSHPTYVDRANPGSLPQPLTSICAALAVLGVLGFAYGLSADPQTAWLAFHSNFIFYANLAQAGLVLSCIFVIVGAKWPGPVKRIAEGLAAWIPVTFVLAIVGYFGREYLFAWAREGAAHGKEPWLNVQRFYLTDLAIFGVLALLAFVYLKNSVRPTLGGAAANASGFAKSMIERWSANWRGDAEERAASAARAPRLATIICLAFALGYTIIAFDQVMSMEQMWFSNLFGAFVSWGGILSAVAACSLLACLHRNSPGLKGAITSDHLHDLGKMLFAFSIFWMYLFFSQYIVIYYGNLPEETMFFMDRLGPQFLIDKAQTPVYFADTWRPFFDFDWSRLDEAYGWISMAVWTFCWITPFWVLLGEQPKRTPAVLGSVAGVVLFGVWLERNLLVWPSVMKNEMWSWVGGVQIAVALGFLGAFSLVFLVYTRIFPTLAVPDRS